MYNQVFLLYISVLSLLLYHARMTLYIIHGLKNRRNIASVFQSVNFPSDVPHLLFFRKKNKI